MAAAIDNRGPKDPVEIIQDGFAHLDKFDDRARRMVQVFFKDVDRSSLQNGRIRDANTLWPEQAQRVIEIAANRFGSEGGMEAFKTLKKSFICDDLFDGEKIYPEAHLRLLKSLTQNQNVDFKTSFFVLQELKFYHETTRHVRRRGGFIIDEYGRLCITKYEKLTPEELIEPIQRFGERFGIDAAKKVVQEARNHYEMERSMTPLILDYFRTAFGESAAAEIKPDLKYNLWDSFWDGFDDFVDDDESSSAHMPGNFSDYK